MVNRRLFGKWIATRVEIKLNGGLLGVLRWNDLLKGNIRERLAELEKLRDPAMWCAWVRLGVGTDSAYVSEDDSERHWPRVFGVAFPAYRGPHGKESAESLAERVRTAIVSLLPDVVRAGWRPTK